MKSLIIYVVLIKIEKKLNILIQRLTDLNQTKMEMIDSKETVNLNHLQIEKELNKSEKQLEFGEENYEKNKLKMSNEYQMELLQLDMEMVMWQF